MCTYAGMYDDILTTIGGHFQRCCHKIPTIAVESAFTRICVVGGLFFVETYVHTYVCICISYFMYTALTKHIYTNILYDVVACFWHRYEYFTFIHADNTTRFAKYLLEHIRFASFRYTSIISNSIYDIILVAQASNKTQYLSQARTKT